MGFLCALSFLSYFDRVCLVRAQEDIQRDLSFNDERMGWIFSAFWLTYALFEIPAGWLGDRFGPRATLTRIVFCWSLFTALSGSATGFVSLLICRLLFGALEAGAFPNMARVQSEWLPLQSRARAGGLLWLLARWGGAFSPLLFGAMLRAFDSPGFRDGLSSIPGLSSLAGTSSWRLGFWAAGLAGAVWCLAYYPWFRDRPSQKSSVNAAELALIRSGRGPKVEEVSLDRRVFGALFTCRSLWALGLLYVCGSFGWSFFVSWMPRYLKEVHAIQFSGSEVMSGLPLFFGGLSCLAGGWLSDRFVRRTGRKWLGRAVFPILGYTTAAVSMYALRFVSSPGEAVFLMCLAGAGNDFGQGANWATIVDLGGRYAGTAAGFINMVGNSGNWLQPTIGARIFNGLGWNALFGVIATMYLIAAASWFFIDPRRSFYESRAEGTEEAAGPPCPPAPASK
jgi:MFS family permease